MRFAAQIHTHRKQTDRRTWRRTWTGTNRHWSSDARCRIEKASETHLFFHIWRQCCFCCYTTAAAAATAIRPFSRHASVSDWLADRAVSGVVGAVAVNGLLDGQPGVIRWRPSWWPLNTTSRLGNGVTPLSALEVIRTEAARTVEMALDLPWPAVI